jgi:hypothetical protein
LPKLLAPPGPRAGKPARNFRTPAGLWANGQAILGISAAPAPAIAVRFMKSRLDSFILFHPLFYLFLLFKRWLIRCSHYWRAAYVGLRLFGNRGKAE